MAMESAGWEPLNEAFAPRLRSISEMVVKRTIPIKGRLHDSWEEFHKSSGSSKSKVAASGEL